jgi:glutamate synthase domain-containing protein 1
MPQGKKQLYKALRIIYGRALLNGPFSILLTFKGGIMALNDRIKLRPLVVGKKDYTYYFSSEEAAIKHVCSDIKDISSPDAGEPVIARLNNEAYNVYYGVEDEED